MRQSITPHQQEASGHRKAVFVEGVGCGVVSPQLNLEPPIPTPLVHEYGKQDDIASAIKLDRTIPHTIALQGT